MSNRIAPRLPILSSRNPPKSKPHPDNVSLRPKCIPIYIPVLVILIAYVASMTLWNLQMATLPLQFYCENEGLDSRCNDDGPQQSAASFGFIIGFSNLLLGAVIGTLSTHTVRFGRKVTAMISLLSIFPSLVVWPILLYMELKQFEPILMICVFITAVTGGILLMYIAIFAIVSDISMSYGSVTRTKLFASVEALSALTAVGSAQLGGWLLDNYDAMTIACVSTILLIGAFILSVLFLDETIDPIIQDTKYKWYSGNSLSSLSFVFQLPCSQSRFENDAKYIYFSNLERYMRDCDVMPTRNDILDTMWEQSDQIQSQTSLSVAGSRHSSNHTNTSGLDLDQQTAPLLVFDPFSSTIKLNNESDYLKSLVPSPNVHGHDDGNKHDPGTQEHGQGDIIKQPAYVPPSNTMRLVSIMLFIYMFSLASTASINYLYMKNKWEIGVKVFSNTTSGEDFSKGLTTFLLLPFIHFLVKSRKSELLVVIISFICYGLAQLGMAMASTKTLFIIFDITAVSSSSLTASFLRGIMVSEVSEHYIQTVMSGIAVVSVISMATGQIFANAVYRATQDVYPNLVYYIIAGMVFLSAFLLPIIFKQSIGVMNQRIITAISYDKKRIDHQRKEGFYQHLPNLHEFDDDITSHSQTSAKNIQYIEEYDPDANVILTL